MTDGWLMEAVQEAWDDDKVLVFECIKCRTRSLEDELVQLQPDGRYGCPMECDIDGGDDHAFNVIPMTVMDPDA